MNSAARIGVFGGTFDPIHNTHIEIARAAIRQAQLDKVLFVVAANPPHKMDATYASANDRYALVDAALRGEPRMEASHIELERDGPSYTVQTLETLRETHPNAELFLIVGSDSLMDLPKWRAPKRIMELAKLLVAPRSGDTVIPAALDGQYELLHFDPNTHSSTEVRRRLESNEGIGELLPDAAVRLIRERGLYCANS